MQNDRDPISSLLDFLGVTDFTNTLFAPTSSSRSSEPSEPSEPSGLLETSDTPDTPDTPDETPITTPEESAEPLKADVGSTDTTADRIPDVAPAADRPLQPPNSNTPVSDTKAVIPPANLLPSEALTISVESVTLDRQVDDRRNEHDDHDLPPQLVVLGEGSMSARYDSVYDSLVRNLARRKRQALADELGDLFDAIQDQGYTYADLLGAMREILATQTSGGLWTDCITDLDRAIERALRAQAESDTFVVKPEAEPEREYRNPPRLESEKFDRDERSDRDDRDDRKTWNDSPITS